MSTSLLRSPHPLSRSARIAVLAAAALLPPSSVLGQDPASEAEPASASHQAFPPATPESQGLSAEALEGLAGELQTYLEREFFVGAELLVVQNRRTVLHRCIGFADREAGEAWVDGTVCNIRSMTKTLTGAAIQILIDREELSLDDRASDFIPGFDNDECREITVRQLLTHRAGLPLTTIEMLDQHESLLKMADAIGENGTDSEPGTRFWYSDSGTDILGAIVEVVSGSSLDQFVRKELLEPLGMGESFYDLDPDHPRRARIASVYFGPGWSLLYDPDTGPFYPFAWGSQTLYSTPEDYAKVLAMWMDGGMAGDARILSEEAVRRTLTPVSEMSMLGSEARFPTSFAGLEVWYGQMSVLHVSEGSAGKEPAVAIGHSGSDGTIAWAWPERDLMVLLFTQSRGGAAVLRFESALERWLLSPKDWSEEPVPDPLAPYLGVYVADWSNYMKEPFEVLWRNGQFVLDIPSQVEFVLERLGDEEKWQFQIAPAVKIWFGEGEDGMVDRLHVQQGSRTFEAPRKGSAREAELAEQNRLDPELVAKLTGAYDDPENERHLVVGTDRDYLSIRRSGEPMLHLWPIPGGNSWQVREAPVVRVTFEEESGEVCSITLRGPGGELTMPRVEERERGGGV